MGLALTIVLFRHAILYGCLPLAAAACRGPTDGPAAATDAPRTAAFVVLAANDADKVLADALEREAGRLAAGAPTFVLRTTAALSTTDEQTTATVARCGADKACLGALATVWEVDELVVCRLLTRPPGLVLQYLALRRGDGALLRSAQDATPDRAGLEARLAASYQQIFGVVPQARSRAAAVAPGEIARCETLAGVARVRRATTLTWEPLVPGAPLYVGDVLETTDGEVVIAYRSGAMGTLAPRSLLVLESGAGTAGVGEQVSLRAGGFSGRGAGLRVRQGDDEAVAITASDATEPLEYRIGVRDGGALEVALRKGKGTLRAASGATVTLQAGEAQDIAAGVLRGTVAKLADFPRLISPGIDATVERIEELAVELRWAAVPKVTTYRLQVATDQSFVHPLVDEQVRAPPYSFLPPTEGTYHWRIASLGTDGRLGEYGFVRRLYVVAEQIPDLLIAPPDDATLAFGGKAVRFVTFSWRAAVPPAPYRLVVTPDPELTEEPALSIVTTSQNVMTRQLEPGIYYWGVFIERTGREKPIFQHARRLTLTD